MRNRVRLAPLTGLDGSRYAEEHEGGSTPMRGGFNVSVVDGEWWVRHGTDSATDPIGSVPWYWLIDTEGTHILASPWYVLKYNINNDKVDSATTPSVTEDVDFTSGSTTATSSTPRTVDELILPREGDEDGTCYRVLSVSGTTMTLDRPWAASTVTVSCKFIPPFVPLIKTGDWAFNRNSRRCGVALIDQLSTHGASSLGYANPAVTAGRKYLIITSDQSGGSEVGPVAIDLSVDSAPCTGWFRNTSEAAPTQLDPSYGAFCTVHNNRLIIASAADPGGKFSSRTIWYSWAGDFLLWHTGIQGKAAAPNYVTFDGEENDITECQTLGPNVIIHRYQSQVIGASTGSGTAPYQYQETPLGYGLRNPGMLVNAGDRHYLESAVGPAVFDGQQLSLVAPELGPHFRSMGLLTSSFIYHDYENQRVVWQGSHSNTRNHLADSPADTAFYFQHSDDDQGYYDVYAPCFVFDYVRSQGWFVDSPTVNAASAGIQTGSAGRQYLVRCNGQIVRRDAAAVGSATGVRSGKEPNIVGWNGSAVTTVTPGVVDALVETPWMGFGSLERKQITKILLDLRAFDSSSSSRLADQISDLDSGATMHFCTLDIFTNGDATTSRASVELSETYSEMMALSLDENNQFPLMQFQLSPRVSGQTFKFRFRNKLPAGSSNDKGTFRIAGIEVFYDQQQSDRPLNTANN